ncbi:MAG: hypothetical protein KDB00_23050, partial [Planctomycetales bacterium]|nr:hypothetical protein [Planctomycetales bacterium]
MLTRLGLRHVAYDWRDQHVASFEEEILQYKKRGIEYFAFWGQHDEAFRLFEKYGMHPQIWNTLGSPEGGTDADRVKAAAMQLMPLVRQTQKMGSKLGLYNHGGWGGEPDNMIAVCQYLREHHNADHVGIVYNLHHGHGHIDDFADVLSKLKPYLLCLNLNGMTRDGEARGQKILPLGEGEFDVQLITALRDSGYDGPVGIIGHTQDDVELRLQDNLDGLHWILPQIDGKPAGPKPAMRTFSPQQPAPNPSQKANGVMLENRSEIRQPPITVECRATLPDANGYNILVASDTKRSGRHWELFSNNGNGMFTAYLPGLNPDHIRSSAMICDGKHHTLGMVYEPQRVRLYVDGKIVADQNVKTLGHEAVDGGLGIARLVEGGLGCRGAIDWVRISRGAVEISAEPTIDVVKNDSTLLFWQRSDQTLPQESQSSVSPRNQSPRSQSLSHHSPREHSPQLVSDLVASATHDGDLHRGLLTFADANSACLSCHRIGRHGGQVGPDLTEIGKQRKPTELVESVLWPKRHIKPEYVGHLVIDQSGQTYQGYLVSKDDKVVVLRDPATNQHTQIPADEIEMQREVGTLMPDNLTGAMSDEQLSGLLRFLFTLGTEDAIASAEMDLLLSHATAHVHGAADFPYDRQPLDPHQWPSWQHTVNRDRIYDFYTKQADYFSAQASVPPLLAEYPGLDGGELGHWGNQNESTWANDRWNDTELGNVMCGVFRGGGVTVPRGVCVQVGADKEMSTCFNPETLEYEVFWRGGFVNFSSHRHGFLDGVRLDGQRIESPPESAASAPPHDGPIKYLGYYRNGDEVVFSYRIGTQAYLDAPGVQDGRFVRVVTPVDAKAFHENLRNAPPHVTPQIETTIRLGDQEDVAGQASDKASGYTIDHIGLPYDNPWKALIYCGGHAFLPDGSALVCTMQGDVWHVSGFEYPSRTATWRRFASGLHHPLGMVADKDGIFVLGRDQITRLHDLNADGEADFYECFSNAFKTSPAGHDFICGLQRDDQGNFYIASGNQGLVRISPDGQRADVIATGFRNPDGLGMLPDGTVTVPC